MDSYKKSEKITIFNKYFHFLNENISLTFFDKTLIELNFSNQGDAQSPEYAEDVFTQLQLFFDGQITQFSFPYHFDTYFKHQQLFMKLLIQSKYGETITYGEMAKKLGNKNLSRNVGFLCSKNPLPIIIPCHRILASNGIGGYTPSIHIKEKILELESIKKAP